MLDAPDIMKAPIYSKEGWNWSGLTYQLTGSTLNTIALLSSANGITSVAGARLSTWGLGTNAINMTSLAMS